MTDRTNQRRDRVVFEHPLLRAGAVHVRAAGTTTAPTLPLPYRRAACPVQATGAHLRTHPTFSPITLRALL